MKATSRILLKRWFFAVSVGCTMCLYGYINLSNPTTGQTLNQESQNFTGKLRQEIAVAQNVWDKVEKVYELYRRF